MNRRKSILTCILTHFYILQLNLPDLISDVSSKLSNFIEKRQFWPYMTRGDDDDARSSSIVHQNQFRKVQLRNFGEWPLFVHYLLCHKVTKRVKRRQSRACELSFSSIFKYELIHFSLLHAIVNFTACDRVVAPL